MTVPATAGETHRVLVVDDEPNIVDVVSMTLRFQGFAVQSRAPEPRRSPR
jgi:two-component system, OmpR family, response regulator